MRRKVLTVLGLVFDLPVVLVFGFLALCMRKIRKRASGLGDLVRNIHQWE